MHTKALLCSDWQVISIIFNKSLYLSSFNELLLNRQIDKLAQFERLFAWVTNEFFTGIKQWKLQTVKRKTNLVSNISETQDWTQHTEDQYVFEFDKNLMLQYYTLLYKIKFSI